MSGGITIRKATKQDAGDLAILDDIASHGLASWLWFRAKKRGEADVAYEHGRERMLDHSQPASFQNAYIAEYEGVTAGMSLGYGIDDAKMSDTLLSVDPVLRPIVELFSLCEGKWLLDGLAVYNNSRHHGVAHELLKHQFMLANSSGHSEMALVAEDSNNDALKLYESFKFETADRRVYIPFNNISHTREWLLMLAPTHS